MLSLSGRLTRMEGLLAIQADVLVQTGATFNVANSKVGNRNGGHCDNLSSDEVSEVSDWIGDSVQQTIDNKIQQELQSYLKRSRKIFTQWSLYRQTGRQYLTRGSTMAQIA